MRRAIINDIVFFIGAAVASCAAPHPIPPQADTPVADVPAEATTTQEATQPQPAVTLPSGKWPDGTYDIRCEPPDDIPVQLAKPAATTVPATYKRPAYQNYSSCGPNGCGNGVFRGRIFGRRR